MPYSRIAHNTATSEMVQGDIGAIASELARVISDRQSQVNNALAEFSADEVDAMFGDVSKRWINASEETKAIIHLVQRTLREDDDTAHQAQQQAKTAIANVG